MLVAALMMTVVTPIKTVWALGNQGGLTTNVDFQNEEESGGAGGSGGSSGGSWSILGAIKNIFSGSSQSTSIGPDFVPGGSSVQLGVNPNSLIPTKDLNTLDSQRISNAVKYGVVLTVCESFF